MTEPFNPPPDGLLRELLWIHDLIRRDLQTMRRLVEDVLMGASTGHVMSEIGSLETGSALWRLRVNRL